MPARDAVHARVYVLYLGTWSVIRRPGWGRLYAWITSTLRTRSQRLLGQRPSCVRARLKPRRTTDCLSVFRRRSRTQLRAHPDPSQMRPPPRSQMRPPPRSQMRPPPRSQMRRGAAWVLVRGGCSRSIPGGHGFQLGGRYSGAGCSLRQASRTAHTLAR